MKILIIEDSERLRRSLSEGLRRSGSAVDQVADGETGLNYALAAVYDVIVLDLILPKLNGLELLEQIRRHGVNAGVLILSAKDQAEDRIRGLELGADDYLIKPFVFDELIARLKALVRRAYNQRNPIIKIGDVSLNTALRRAVKNGRELPLTPNELRLFEILAINRGRAMSQDHLQDHLYSSDQALTRNAIEAHVSALRKKLRAAGEANIIQTRRGFGYYIDVD
ncbi:MAG: response regulator transcription factor [Alphaproteobacteria bacterium]